MIIDSHAHLDDARFDSDRKQVIENIKQSKIDRVINVGSDLSSSIASVEMAQQYNFIYAACGIHPHEASSYSDEIEIELEKLLQMEKVVAIGEIGFDFYYNHSPKDIQEEVFIKQINIANKYKKPIVIHDREAHRMTLDTLIKHKQNDVQGVFHSYSGSSEMIKEVIDLDFYLSFNGIVTFKNAKKTHEAVKNTPMDRLLIETDSPYLTPHPYRGRRNDSTYVIYVAQTIAEIKNKQVEEIFEVTWNNACKLFNL